MKVRIIVAAVGIPLLFGLVCFLPLWAFALCVGFISSMVAMEMLRCVCPEIKSRFVVYTVISCVLIPLGSSFGSGTAASAAAVFMLPLLMSCEMIAAYQIGGEPLELEDIALVLFAGTAMPLFLSALVRLGLRDSAPVYMLLPFVVTFSSDSGGYLVGSYFGKHKLADKVSPAKTIEGSIGGFVCAIVLVLVYGLILKLLGYTVSFGVLAIYGFIGSVVCQIGDLFFSVIKRLAGIKDYGDLIPGHGGMLDRFDSIHFTAPVIEVLLLWINVISKSG